MNRIGPSTLDRLRNGDHKAFDEIFIAYYNRIKNFINGLLKSEEDAEELTQEIFVRLWINHESIDPQKSLNAYLYTIARNTTFNFIKQKLVRDSYVETYPKITESENPEEIIFAREIGLLMEMAVERMPVQRKRIYQLSRNKGLSNEEIAEKLGVSKKKL